MKKLGQIGHFNGLDPVAATLLQSFPNFRRQGSSSLEFSASRRITEENGIIGISLFSDWLVVLSSEFSLASEELEFSGAIHVI